MSHIPTLDELVGSPAQRSPQAEKKHARLTANAEIHSGVNQTAIDAPLPAAGISSDVAAQVVAAEQVMADGQGAVTDADDATNCRAGGQETQKPVNHTQVVVSQETPTEMQQLLVNIGVNLSVNQVGRKNVLDEFMRGRLVSLLAMGLTLRQSAAALGLSHNAIWKQLKRNPELTEQVNAARFQAQIEPLLVVLRESKRNWRAATWLMNYLSKSVAKHEETPDEAILRQQEEKDEYYRDCDARSLQRDKDRKAAERKAAMDSEADRKHQRQQKQPKRAPADTVRSLAEEMAAFLGVNPPEPGSAK